MATVWSPRTAFVILSLAGIWSGCATARGASTLFGGVRPSSVESATGQSITPSGEEEPQIQPDRPDQTNAAYTVPKGLVQLEMGGQYSRVDVSGESTATPLTVRAGITHWFEARLDTDGVTRDREPDQTSTDFAGLTVGGKFRLWAPRRGAPVLTVEPGITLPWGRPDGGTDYVLTFITSVGLRRHVHLDVNYALGEIAASQSHFFQQMVSASANVDAGKRWNPYFEAYWFSQVAPDARPDVVIDAGAIYSVTPRVAIDGGVAFGLSAAANGPSVFGGLSVIAGAVGSGGSVRARLRDAQRRGDR